MFRGDSNFHKVIGSETERDYPEEPTELQQSIILLFVGGGTCNADPVDYSNCFQSQ